MALTEKHRSSIYQHFVPILGEEEASALLAQFPSRDLDEPATKEFVRAETAELRADIAELRAEVRGDIASLGTEIAELRAEVKSDIAGQFRWIMGIWITSMGLWVTILGVVAAFAVKA